MSNPSENWFSLDLSSSVGSIAIHRLVAGTLQPTLLAETQLKDTGKHSESVLNAVQEVLETAALKLSDIDRYVTTTGPGSFTGLRIAFSVLKAFALTNGKPLELVDGHEARALAYVATGVVPFPATFEIATPISREAFLITRFRAKSPTRVDLIDERTENSAAETPALPLRASHLGQVLRHAQTRQTLISAKEIGEASPRYFGSRF